LLEYLESVQDRVNKNLDNKNALTMLKSSIPYMMQKVLKNGYCFLGILSR
jgi:hypothetical protein